MRRLFLGAEVISPWMELPKEGREISSFMRHITLEFFGFTKEDPPLTKVPFEIGPAGILDRLLFLPEEKPRVIAYHANILSQKEKLCALAKKSFRPFLPHVTIARSESPNLSKWESWFSPLPFFISAIHLYESLENLKYVPLKSLSLLAPFEPIEHTADIAFLIRGTSFQDLFIHAALSLAFFYPPIVSYIEPFQNKPLDSLIAVIENLNALVTKVDIEMGAPLKAVSFQGDVREKNNIWEWEMIVDV